MISRHMVRELPKCRRKTETEPSMFLLLNQVAHWSAMSLNKIASPPEQRLLLTGCYIYIKDIMEPLFCMQLWAN